MKRSLTLFFLAALLAATNWPSAEACGRRHWRRGPTVNACRPVSRSPIIPARELEKNPTPTFAIHSYEAVEPALGFGPLQAELEKRGFRCVIVRSPRTKTKTPNQDRARIMVEALKDVKGDIALVGISNQGLFMPLVAAARPIRRIVMLNAVIPQPGKSFAEAFDFDRVFASWPTAFIARRAPGMNETCPLCELPKTEYVYVCGEKDDAIRPEWEQWAARELLHVEPVVIKGAGHASILKYAGEIADAATSGLQQP
jgi:pimeloyl-ACP methyl ester carboxylesterase